jgi:asparagine synthase (glutamine-hydrolysing)
VCGIAGIVDLRRATSPDELAATVRAMGRTLSHRGPDDEGVWCDAAAGIAFAARRLAIRDLSPAGHQPMVSDDGGLVLVFNGEIYDADALRAELDSLGHRFRGTSDTEVLLNACARWGVAGALPRLNGMFAFALWETGTRRLTLVRDRMGIKPLYWATTGDLLLFVSELKALRAHAGWTPEIDRDALAAYARLSYVPAPHCIWTGARKLEPGCALTLEPGRPPQTWRYWDMAALAQGDRTIHGAREAAPRLEALLGTAVRRRLVADVPVGVFLSGGIDSATVTALAQIHADTPVKTFAVGFAESAYDEAKNAALVARHLGTDHHELLLSAEETRALIPELPSWFDEPFADSSQVATLALARFARTEVTVALSGDGGDETFGGYNRYAWAARYWPWQRRVPAPFRRLAAAALEQVSPGAWDRVLGATPYRHPGEKLHKFAQILALDDLDSVYRRLTGPGVDTFGAVPGGREPPAPVPPPLDDAVERLQFLDTVGYLPDDILTKVDRATMAVGLEARVPFLDHEVIEFAWQLPRALKVSDVKSKRILRDVLGRHLPAKLFEGRAKSGFAIPLAGWLRGSLRDWGQSLLEDVTRTGEQWFDAKIVTGWWNDHQSQRADRHHALWNVLMFQAWLRRQRNGS